MGVGFWFGFRFRFGWASGSGGCGGPGPRAAARLSAIAETLAAGATSWKESLKSKPRKSCLAQGYGEG